MIKVGKAPLAGPWRTPAEQASGRKVKTPTPWRPARDSGYRLPVKVLFTRRKICSGRSGR